MRVSRLFSCMHRACRAILLASAVTLLFCLPAWAHDWPQFLGPSRNGIYAGPALAHAWPKDGPPLAWQKNIGQGFSGPVVAAGKLILFHRLGDDEIVECVNAASGERLWVFQYRSNYRDQFGFDEGPRSTPAIHDGRVFTLGAEGMFHCLDLQTGRKIWEADTKRLFSASQGFFGLACSPLVDGKSVLLNIGGRNGAGIVAFDCSTGNVLWKATDHEASYSSPVIASIGGRRHALFFTREGLVSLEPATGRVQLEFPWRARSHASVNAATPLVVDDLVFVSASYETGGAVLRIRGTEFEKRWSSDEVLSNHYATSVHHAGFLFGFHGRQETGPEFRCIELRNGAVKWSKEGLPAGTVTRAGDLLLLLLEDGRLLLVAASPETFRTRSEAQILGSGVRAYPALANGFFYARNKNKLVSVDLRNRPER